MRQSLEEPFSDTDEKALDGLEAQLLEAVGLQQIAAAPLGAFLSGGIDSHLQTLHCCKCTLTILVNFYDRIH